VSRRAPRAALVVMEESSARAPMTTAGAAVLPGTGEMSDTKCRKDLDFVSEVDRDVPIAIYAETYRAGTARSTFPIV